MGPYSDVSRNVLPSAKYAVRTWHPVALCRAASPSIVIFAPVANDSGFKPLRDSTVRDAISQLQVSILPAASATSM